METILTLIFVSALLIGSLVTYQHKRVKIRRFVLSEQWYPSINLQLSLEKKQGKISHVILHITALKSIDINKIKIELINRKREFNYYNLEEKKLIKQAGKNLSNKEFISYKIEYLELKNLLEQGELPFRTFRFVVIDKLGKTYKTHELGLNKKWELMRPDSGNYN